MAQGIGYSREDARRIFDEYLASGGNPRDTNIEAIMAGNLPRRGPSRPPASQGGERAAQVPEKELLRRLLTGSATGPAGSAALHQLGLVPSGGGFGMDALEFVISQNQLEGAPPVPFEIPGTADEAVTGLLEGSIAPDQREKAMRALLGGMEKRGRLPGGLEALLR